MAFRISQCENFRFAAVAEGRVSGNQRPTVDVEESFSRTRRTEIGHHHDKRTDAPASRRCARLPLDLAGRGDCQAEVVDTMEFVDKRETNVKSSVNDVPHLLAAAASPAMSLAIQWRRLASRRPLVRGVHRRSDEIL